ncbi:hypothetical protein DACRYDRAFT_105585 [Dacryopinax primogenitus]|uniref:Replication factor A C-terminal domain-containing protein n=1 Tax=Dacryopinax primogenitus (strain DJM 731) TaxID=1858805 RepID=M5GEN4_DACPD|nr:uncharacterized protein DACRYDRAFT_105585 [Dacryopinax primogenitus]EJU03423.1 hypothetical protein DACRYDRAFT_105585 [Dacryopinax primogenitus]
MVFGSPENFSTILQIVASERLGAKEPADWMQVHMFSDRDWTFRTTAGLKIGLSWNVGTLKLYDVIKVTTYRQWVPRGSNKSYIVVQDYAKMGSAGTLLKKPSMDVTPDVNHGALGSQAHWAQAAPGQYHPPEQEHVRASKRWLDVRDVLFAIDVRVWEVKEEKQATDGKWKRSRVLAILLDLTAEILIIAFGAQTFRIHIQIECTHVQEAAEGFRQVPHKFQLILEEHAVIMEIHDPSIPRIFLTFRCLNTIERLRVYEIIDVLAVVVCVGRVMKGGPAKTGRVEQGLQVTYTSHRDVWLVDNSKVAIRLCMFDLFQNIFKQAENKVIGIKSVVVDMLDRPCLKTQKGCTQFVFQDGNPGYERLMEWYKDADPKEWRTITGSFSADGFPKSDITIPNETIMIKVAQDAKLGLTSKKTFKVITKVLVKNYKDYLYKGCLYEDCNKKTPTQKIGNVFVCPMCDTPCIAPGIK